MSFIDKVFNLFEEPKKPVRSSRPRPVNKARGNWLLPSDTRPAEIPDIMNQYDRVQYGGLNQVANLQDLKMLSMYSDIIYLSFNKLKFEMFRGGFDINSKFDGAVEEQEERINDFLKCCNENSQTLKEVFEELEDDLNTFDDCYGLLLKKYEVNELNEIMSGNVNEFIRLNPLTVTMVFDNLQRIGRDEEGKVLYFKINDRSETTYEAYDKKTGLQNLRACYKVKGKDKDIYYDRTEIIHCSKYKPSKLYGFSPLYSLYNKIMILLNQDKYIKDYYSGNKAPKILITANTSNTASFKQALKEWKDKTRQDPHGVHPILHQKTAGDTSDVFSFINLMNTLNEMQYTQTREEIRRNIGALYGVSPVFMNDVSTSGGLNNEGLQITVTDRSIELGQQIYNEKILPFIFEQMGITDYEVTLVPNKEEDLAFEKDLRLKELQIAKMTAELGINTRMNEEGNFIYEAGHVDISQTQPEFIPFQNNEEGVTVETPVKLSKSKKESPEQDLQTTLEKELEKILKRLDRKRKPSEEEFNKIVDDISKKLGTQAKKKSSTRLKTIYEKSMKETAKELDTQLTLNEKDKNVIEALKRDVVYQKAFKNLSENVSKRLKDVIEEAYADPKSFTINNIVDSMKEELEKTDNELRTIARTETSKISIAARKTSYDKTGVTYKYKWVGPDDRRTSDVSKEIKKRTNNGVSWEELVRIIQEEATKKSSKWEVNPLAPIPHPNTRHTFIAERVD